MDDYRQDPLFRALVNAWATRPDKYQKTGTTARDFKHVLDILQPIIATEARRKALEEAQTLCQTIVRVYDDEAYEKFMRPGEFTAGAKSSAAEECAETIRALIPAP